MFGMALDIIKALMVALGLWLILVLPYLIIPWIVVFVLLRYQREQNRKDDIDEPA